MTISFSRSGIGYSDRLQNSHTRLAGVLGGVTWSVYKLEVCVCWLDCIVGGENTLKARCHPFMLLNRGGYVRLGMAGEVGPWFRRSKVWFPRQHSDGV